MTTALVVASRLVLLLKGDPSSLDAVAFYRRFGAAPPLPASSRWIWIFRGFVQYRCYMIISNVIFCLYRFLERMTGSLPQPSPVPSDAAC